MVRVIGEAPEVLRQTNCRRCAAKLEYTIGEIKERVEKDYGGGTDVVYHIHCPRCFSEVVTKPPYA